MLIIDKDRIILLVFREKEEAKLGAGGKIRSRRCYRRLRSLRLFRDNPGGIAPEARQLETNIQGIRREIRRGRTGTYATSGPYVSVHKRPKLIARIPSSQQFRHKYRATIRGTACARPRKWRIEEINFVAFRNDPNRTYFSRNVIDISIKTVDIEKRNEIYIRTWKNKNCILGKNLIGGDLKGLVGENRKAGKGERRG